MCKPSKMIYQDKNGIITAFTLFKVEIVNRDELEGGTGCYGAPRCSLSGMFGCYCFTQGDWQITQSSISCCMKGQQNLSLARWVTLSAPVYPISSRRCFSAVNFCSLGRTNSFCCPVCLYRIPLSSVSLFHSYWSACLSTHLSLIHFIRIPSVFLFVFFFR